MEFVKYSNKRTGKTTSWNSKNANKQLSQFMIDNKHLGYTNEELTEAHELIVSTVKGKGKTEEIKNTGVDEKKK